MRAKKLKGPLRNFNFEQEADRALVQRSKETGRHMVVVIEDLLLGRRQFGPVIEQYISARVLTWGIPRLQVIENALIHAIHTHAENHSATPLRQPETEASTRN